MSGADQRPALLVVGGFGGLVGRSLLPELLPRYRLRSVHRHPVAAETTAGVEWVREDIGPETPWDDLLRDVSHVVILSWYRWARPGRFRRLGLGLERLVEAATRAQKPRVVHVSVPAAPAELEERLPYLAWKRRVDRALEQSGLSYRIVRPSMLYGRGDRLLGVMLRMMRRYRRFPMFGDGRYHVSPIAVEDVARILRDELDGGSQGTVDAGGPERWVYSELTDRMFAVLGRPPRYVRLAPRTSVAVAQLVQDLGSSLIYAYEVEWLLSDRLGLPPYPVPGPALRPVGEYLVAEAQRIGGAQRPIPSAGRA